MLRFFRRRNQDPADEVYVGMTAHDWEAMPSEERRALFARIAAAAESEAAIARASALERLELANERLAAENDERFTEALAAMFARQSTPPELN